LSDVDLPFPCGGRLKPIPVIGHSETLNRPEKPQSGIANSRNESSRFRLRLRALKTQKKLRIRVALSKHIVHSRLQVGHSVFRED
jgi:hypothetical protein